MSLRVRKHSFKPNKPPCFFVVLLQNSSEPLVYYAPENNCFWYIMLQKIIVCCIIVVLIVLIVVLMLMGSRCLQLGIFVSPKLLPRKTPMFLSVGSNTVQTKRHWNGLPAPPPHSEGPSHSVLEMALMPHVPTLRPADFRLVQQASPSLFPVTLSSPSWNSGTLRFANGACCECFLFKENCLHEESPVSPLSPCPPCFYSQPGHRGFFLIERGDPAYPLAEVTDLMDMRALWILLVRMRLIWASCFSNVSLLKEKY